jgi:ribonuclease D
MEILNSFQAEKFWKMFSYVESIILWLRKAILRLSLPSRVSKGRIMRLPLMSYAGEIVVINSAEGARLAVDELKLEKVLGFDSESRPAFKKGEAHDPSIIQLAGEDRVYIFQLSKIGGLEPIREILESASIKKVGVGVEHDIMRLRGISFFNARNFCDLGDISHRLGISHTGLRNLAAIFFEKRISKSMQLSDWSQPELSNKQKEYAATDAWASRQLYFRMRSFE